MCEVCSAGVDIVGWTNTLVQGTVRGAPGMACEGSNRQRGGTVTASGQHSGGYVELLQGPPVGSRVLMGAATFVLPGDTVKPEQVQVAGAR